MAEEQKKQGKTIEEINAEWEKRFADVKAEADRAEKRFRDTEQRMHAATTEAAELRRRVEDRQNENGWRDFEERVRKQFEEDPVDTILSLNRENATRVAQTEKKVLAAIEDLGRSVSRRMVESDPKTAKYGKLLRELDGVRDESERVEILERYYKDMANEKAQEDLKVTQEGRAERKRDPDDVERAIREDPEAMRIAKKFGITPKEVADSVKTGTRFSAEDDKKALAMFTGEERQ